MLDKAKTPILFFSLLLASSACGSSKGSASDGGRDAPSEAGITQQLCAQMCQVALQVVCPSQPTMDACVTSCLSDTTPCASQTSAYYACLVTAGPGALMCDQVQQLVVLKSGYCSKESADLVTCLSM